MEASVGSTDRMPVSFVSELGRCKTMYTKMRELYDS
jgi:hypothetical protein